MSEFAGMVAGDDSTKFSPWLATGCLSPRQVYHELTKYQSQRTANKSTYWVQVTEAAIFASSECVTVAEHVAEHVAAARERQRNSAGSASPPCLLEQSFDTSDSVDCMCFD